MNDGVQACIPMTNWTALSNLFREDSLSFRGRIANKTRIVLLLSHREIHLISNVNFQRFGIKTTFHSKTKFQNLERSYNLMLLEQTVEASMMTLCNLRSQGYHSEKLGTVSAEIHPTLGKKGTGYITSLSFTKSNICL